MIDTRAVELSINLKILPPPAIKKIDSVWVADNVRAISGRKTSDFGTSGHVPGGEKREASADSVVQWCDHGFKRTVSLG